MRLLNNEGAVTMNRLSGISTVLMAVLIFVGPELSADEPPSNNPRRAHVKALIMKGLPDTDPEIVDVWVDAWQDLGDDEIRFLMEQKRQGGGTLSDFPLLAPTPDADWLNMDDGGVGLSNPLISPLAPSDGLLNSRYGSEPLQRLSAIACVNLENIMTVGYRSRREVRVLAPGGTGESQSSLLPGLELGPRIATGDPLHFAILLDGPVFFELDNGTLTRNGMFERLSDGRLGLSVGSDSVALKESPIVPADMPTDSLRLLEGKPSVGDDLRQIMRNIRIVRAGRLTDLRTRDGVYFTSNAQVEPVESEQLLPGHLELGNVDVEEALKLLKLVEAARRSSSARIAP